MRRKRTISRLGIVIVNQILCSFMIIGSAVAQCESPGTLSISIIPTEETIQELIIYKPVIDYLSKTTGKKIEFYVPASYTNVIEAMTGKWVDVAVYGPYSYVIASNKDPDIQVFATYKKKKGYLQEEGPWYKSVLISRKGSKYTTVDSLRGASVVLTDPASTSGDLVPRTLFAKMTGKPLEAFFGKVVYSGGHDLSALAVFEGIVDAAFVATHRFDHAIARGMVKKEDFNYLWHSPAIPLDPICYRGSLCPDLKRKIERTFLSLHTQPSSARFFKNINASRFVQMTPKDYDVIRALNKSKLQKR